MSQFTKMAFWKQCVGGTTRNFHKQMDEHLVDIVGGLTTSLAICCLENDCELAWEYTKYTKALKKKN